MRKLKGTSTSPFAFVSERGGPLSPDMIARIVERAGEGAKAWISRPPAHAAACYGIRPDQRRHGHATDTGLPGLRIDRQHRARRATGSWSPIWRCGLVATTRPGGFVIDAYWVAPVRWSVLGTAGCPYAPPPPLVGIEEPSDPDRHCQCPRDAALSWSPPHPNNLAGRATDVVWQRLPAGATQQHATRRHHSADGSERGPRGA